LPAELPKVEGWEIASYFKAAKEVAGDFYDAFILPDGNLAFVVADVCGKGIGAALYMTLFRSLIRATTTESASDLITPAQRLQHSISFTNNYVAETHEMVNMFATVFIGILEPKSGKLTYINGGNEPALIVGKDGNVHTELVRTGPAVGAISQASFNTKEITLSNDDVLIAFTDGIPDTQNIKSEFFGKNGMLEILKTKNTNATGLVDKIEKSLQEFIGSAEQFDDITLLAIKKNT
jgi:serine phosphatase RsbU (regulator of sigma subunit)